ncbi:ABC transporter substrate binding protein [Desulfobacterales bacterium HSG16]|nr:ABC transporter substrate binding protein [Desulfobacterales bacterium HSG16]
MKKAQAVLLMAIILLCLPIVIHAKTILVIESYNAEYEWDISYKQGLSSVLKNHEILYFQMNTKNLPPSEHENRANLAWEKYTQIAPDLVILGDDNAVKYLCPKFAATNTPVVYLGLNSNPRYYDAYEKQNITGVLERPLLKRSIIFLKDIIKPEPDKILILFDSGTTSHVLLSEAFKGKKSIDIYDTSVHLKLIKKMDTWKETIINSKKQGYDAVIIGLFHTIIDDNGNHIKDSEILKWTSENTPVPPFCFWDFAAGKGKTVGGFVLHGKSQGEAAGKIAAKILAGESPANIHPVTGKKGKFLFSRSQLLKWKLVLPSNIESSAEYID